MTDSVMTPREIVHELDKHIIGQSDAKRAVAIALRNRFRRQQVAAPLNKEITPKNILMIGPTGVGKTEIARRLATLAKAPFIKVEATKFTEVGYVGRDVESIIRDLAEVGYKMAKSVARTEVMASAEAIAIERILDSLVPPAKKKRIGFANEPDDGNPTDSPARQAFRTRLLKGELDEQLIEVDVRGPNIGVEIMAPPGMEDMTQQLQGLFKDMHSERKRPKTMTVKEALKAVKEEAADELLDEADLKTKAVELVEQSGIVFVDEFDKITHRSDQRGGEVSREGVQRDLLPLVEGASVNTKFGTVNTDHILFIASGAFHLTKPSDLIPELQGRLPIRVELKALTQKDFEKILTEPNASLTVQYQALLATEGVDLVFEPSGVQRIAEMAFTVNESQENIGARRLHTLMERILDEISFDASEKSGETITIDASYVDDKLANLIRDEDLTQFIL